MYIYLSIHLSLSLSMYVYIYIYIYRERERDVFDLAICYRCCLSFILFCEADQAAAEADAALAQAYT